MFNKQLYNNYCKITINHLVLFNTCPNELDDVHVNKYQSIRHSTANPIFF